MDLLDTERKTWLSRLEESVLTRTEAQRELQKLTLERDRLLRHNKQLKESFTNSKIEATDENEAVNKAAESARNDFSAVDSDLRAEQKKQEFHARLGSRFGKVKYSDWLNQQQSHLQEPSN